MGGEQGCTVAHSLHRLLTLPCVQMLLPPESLQTLLCMPCMQRPPAASAFFASGFCFCRENLGSWRYSCASNTGRSSSNNNESFRKVSPSAHCNGSYPA